MTFVIKRNVIKMDILFAVYRKRFGLKMTEILTFESNHEGVSELAVEGTLY